MKTSLVFWLCCLNFVTQSPDDIPAAILGQLGTKIQHALREMRPPYSLMDVLTDTELNAIVSTSALMKKYNIDFDRESAYEVLGLKSVSRTKSRRR